ncbi:hypothetical protein GCM10022197_37350 [Microlunatus spumicola]|uniref:Integral membrane protein n=1 Tax=Microlunatus spumicola TaxID=81499 RepID=A0ABP6Y325_9ACTN
MAERETRRDVEAALAARRDLGPEYDDAVAAGLAERMDELVAIRLAHERGDVSERQLDREDVRTSQRQRFVLGIVSLGAGIPVTAISSESVVMAAVAWAGIVGVNVAAAWGDRRRR